MCVHPEQARRGDTHVVTAVAQREGRAEWFPHQDGRSVVQHAKATQKHDGQHRCGLREQVVTRLFDQPPGIVDGSAVERLPSSPTRTSPDLRLLDLFAGCGGLTQGFVATGRYRPVGAVELDPSAAATYAANFGEHVHQGGIEDRSRGSFPAVDVVVGGPPCQGFSNLGRRDPQDPRNSLWRHFADVLARVSPAFFVIENVPRFLHSPDYAALLQATRRGGRLERWGLEPHLLDARDFGVPQARLRAVLIGRPRGMRPLGPPARREDRPLVLSDAISHVDAKVRRSELPMSRTTILGREVPGIFTMADLHLTPVASPISLRRYGAVPPGGSRLDLPNELKLPAWRRDFRGAGDVMGRLRWDRPAVTIRTEFFRPEKGRFLHPDEDRAITHYEAALLQGFPEVFRWCGSKAAIARQIGNAVPVPMATDIARHLQRFFG